MTAFAFAVCGRKRAPAITWETPPAQAPHGSAFAAVAEKIRPAVVVLATFDEHGGLIANQHAFFISPDGDLVAEHSAMNNAASAIVKSGGGRAYDIFGTYVRSNTPNFILLKTNAHDVPSLDDSVAAANVPDGAPAAIVLSSVGNSQSPLLEGEITGRKTDEDGEWLTFEPLPPKTALGAPVIDQNGAIIGIVSQRDDGDGPGVFRATGTATPLTAEISPEEIAPPAEGPPASSPAAPPRASIPAKLGAYHRRLIYAPALPYPQKLAWTHWNLRASGSYQLTFNAEGKARDVLVAHSAGNWEMDKSAIETLRSWRAEPGQEWSIVVPITFRQ